MDSFSSASKGIYQLLRVHYIGPSLQFHLFFAVNIKIFFLVGLFVSIDSQQ